MLAPLGAADIPSVLGGVYNNDAADLYFQVLNAMLSLGAVAALAVGGYVAFGVVRRGLRWMNTALR